MSRHHVQEHVDLIAKQEQEFLAKRTGPERAADRVAACAGTVTFVEALLLASLILMRQSRIGRRADERARCLVELDKPTAGDLLSGPHQYQESAGWPM